MSQSAHDEHQHHEGARVEDHHAHAEPAPGAQEFSVDRILDPAFWEERYAASESVWSGKPNQVVVDEVGDLPPGRALDVAAGEGGDVVWLAQRGWSVVALDVSATALRRCQDAADARGLGALVTTVEHDAVTWRDDAGYDLVTSAFMHLPPELRGAWLANLAGLVAPGGTLLIVGHHALDLQTTVGRPNHPELFADAAEFVEGLPADEWQVVTAEARPRPAVDAEGREITLHDAVLRAIRLAP